MSKTELNFDDLEPKFERVSISRRTYVLREATGGAVVQWRNHQMSASKLNPDGKTVSVGPIAESEPLLVSLCLFEIVQQGGNEVERQVPVQVVKGWPYRVQRALYERIMEMSDLKEKDSADDIKKRMAEDREKLEKIEANGHHEDASKNSQSATTAGSV
jgi:hypothetical protein